jgi:hypothetical protein
MGSAATSSMLGACQMAGQKSVVTPLNERTQPVEKDKNFGSSSSSGKTTQKSENSDRYLTRTPPLKNERLFSSEFLDECGNLSNNHMERDIFMKFIFSGLWKKILFQEIRFSLMSSTANFLYTYPNQVPKDEDFELNGKLLKSFLTYLKFPELQSLFLACSLSCFFLYRHNLDFAVDTSYQAVTRQEILNSLYVLKNEETIDEKLDDRMERFLEQYNDDDRIVDMEEIFAMLLIHSSPEEIGELVCSGGWHPLVSTSLEKLSLHICLWDLTDYQQQQQEQQREQRNKSAVPSSAPFVPFNFPLLYSNRVELFLPVELCASSARSSYFSSSASAYKMIHDEVDFIRKYFTPPSRTVKKLVVHRTTEDDSNLSFFQKHVLAKRKAWKVFLPVFDKEGHRITSNSNSTSNESSSRSVNNNSNKSPLFFSACPVYQKRNERMTLLTVHSSINVVDKLFLQVLDILLFCLGGIQSQTIGF